MTESASLYSLKFPYYWSLNIWLSSVRSKTLVGGVLPLCRDAVDVFCRPNQLDHQLFLSVKQFFFKHFTLAEVHILFCLHTVKCKNSSFRTILFSVITQFRSIRPISGPTTLGQSGPGTDGNEGVLRIPQSSSITEASTSDCLESYRRTVVGRAFPSALMQLEYSTAPGDWAKYTSSVFLFLFLIIIRFGNLAGISWDVSFLSLGFHILAVSWLFHVRFRQFVSWNILFSFSVFLVLLGLLLLAAIIRHYLLSF